MYRRIFGIDSVKNFFSRMIPKYGRNVSIRIAPVIYKISEKM